jgi:type II secretory ATPase GspE/PulE/Tfp pilus assembly ATPase PilB-like protein
MIQIIAEIQAEPAVLMSITKPILMLAVLGGWAWLVGRLDKDAGFYYANQTQWGMAHLGIAVLGFAVMLFVPIFWVGWFLGILVLVGGAFGYVAFRNGKVPEEERWNPKDIVNELSKKHERERGERAKKQAKVNFVDKSGAVMEVPHGDDPRTPAFELFQDMLVFAVPRGADRIDMTVDADKASFVVRIDGVRIAQPAPDKALCVQLIDYLKENAGMDLAERRKKQSGSLGVEVEGYDHHKIKLTTAGSTRALQLTIEFDLEDKHKIKLEDLGLMPKQFEAVEQLTKELAGVVIFASPPGTGTTTSMYSLMNHHDPYTSSVMTYEKHSPYTMEGVNHNPFPEGASNEQITEEFASLLRSDPNVMLVEQLVSPEMAQLIAKQAEDTRFYISLPARDTISALKLWIKIVGDKRLAAESLSLIMSQRLTRRLCLTCRAPYHPDAAAMKKLNMTKETATHLYKASGKVVVKEEQSTCQDCHGLGYRGRIGVFEVMPVDREASSLIASGEGERLKAHLRKQHMVYLQEAALSKVVEGVSDIKEVTRIMAEHQKA